MALRRAWVGIDIGKQTHWAVVLDAEGAVVWSRRIANDQAAIQELLKAAAGLADELVWAVDVTSGPAALLVTLLWQHDQRVVYVPGQAVNRAAEGYRGEGKTDAKDARVIADQARMRRDFAVLAPTGELLVELGLLVTHRRDLVVDRARQVTRLRELLVGIFPGLERALDLTAKGPLTLLCRYQTPTAIGAAGSQQLTGWLRAQGVRNPAALAAKAIQAAKAQPVRLPAEQLTAGLIAELAGEVMRLTERIAELDKTLQQRFCRHPHAGVLTSLPGMGVLLAAEFLVATGGGVAGFASADHLAAYAGLAPAPHDSGKRVGNLHRPRRYNRMLQRACYLSALSSLRSCQASHDYYTRKRTEGKRHTQALIALARRRINVIWVLLRDGRCFTVDPPDADAAA